MQQIVLPKLLSRERIIARVAQLLASLPFDKAWRIEIQEHKARRSDQQNKYLWAIYDEILKSGGEEMGGWTRSDLHDFFLITHFGSEVRELFGKKRHVPLRRSSRLNKQEFTDFVETILRFMAERGIYIRSPDEYHEAA